MQLTVPQRSVADTMSFPVEPAGVSHWLEKLRPMQSNADAREVYRGLKHSNRLHNDITRRRAIIACFIPVLRDLQAHLMENCCAQPMPLTRNFQKFARLADALLREEAFAFKILLADSDEPQADDIRRAMQALSRQAEFAVHGYRQVPNALLTDAHQIFALAEQHGLEHTGTGRLTTTADHYRYIVLLAGADLHQQRARQLPLVQEFINEHKDAVTIASQPFSSDCLAVQLDQGMPPIDARSLLGGEPALQRYFALSPLLEKIDSRLAKTRATANSAPGVDTLERQTLARLRLSLCRSRQRRNARSVCHDSREVVLGLQGISTRLQYQHTIDSEDEQQAREAEADVWVVKNQSTQGALLRAKESRPGRVQVGELITILNSDKTALPEPDRPDAKANNLLGLVRWIRVEKDNAMTMGIEYLARGILPVNINRLDTSGTQSADTALRDNALIIACRVHNQVMQTMLLPAFQYQTGEKLNATLNDRSRRLQLKQCLQSNGMFCHFSLIDA